MMTPLLRLSCLPALVVVLLGCEPKLARLEACTADAHCDYGWRCRDSRCEPNVDECTPGEPGDCPGGLCDAGAEVARCVTRLSDQCGPQEEDPLPRECTSHHQCPTGAVCLGSHCRFAIEDDEMGYLRQVAFPSVAVLDSFDVDPVVRSSAGATVLAWTPPGDEDLVEYYLVAVTRELPAVAGRGIASYDRIVIGEDFIEAKAPSSAKVSTLVGNGIEPGAYAWFVLGYDGLEVVAASRVRQLDVLPDEPSQDLCPPDSMGFAQIRVPDSGCRRRCASDEDCLVGDDRPGGPVCLLVPSDGPTGIVGGCVDPLFTDACAPAP